MNDDANHDPASRVTREIDPWLHAGEQEAQRRYGGAEVWQPQYLNAMFRDAISPALAAWLEGLPFFFIATANTAGECDCSFRGRETDAAGRPYPVLKVLDAKTLVFPDYRGNQVFNSLGNLIVNGHIGMLFVDFESQRRARLNGAARIIEDQAAHADLWPQAQRYVEVTATQVYGNCKARIPAMTFASKGG